MTDGVERLPRRATLADVAKRAGVSPALVSIVMREAPGASDASRRRVLAVARDLGYRPDARARSLARTKAHVIGVLFGQAGRFQLELIDGLYAAAEERGWDLVLSALTESRDERRALDSLADLRVDALIMLGPPVAEPVLAGAVPTVVIGWHVEHPLVDVVRVRDERAMALVVEHLVELGHRRITHLQGGEGLIAQARRDGYLHAMDAHGLRAETRIVLCEGEDQIHGQRAALRMLEDGTEPPTALVAFNDDIAVAAMSVLSQQGLSVPGDVSVVGFDDSALAHSPGIDLTTVLQPAREMARLAVERMVERSDGSAIGEREITLEPDLCVRRTTGSPRAG